jgi:CHRD domain
MIRSLKILGLIIMTGVLMSSSCNEKDTVVAPAPVLPDVRFRAVINGAAEVPTNASTATGTATAVYSQTTKLLTITVSYTGLVVTASHIHRGSPGNNGAIQVDFGAIITSSPFTFTTTQLDVTKESDLLNNLYYVNIHSAAFPGGEIRGQLIRQ